MNILILGAGGMQIPAIKEAKKMGHFVLCADGNPDAEGKSLCDVFYPVDLKDREGLLEVAGKFHSKHGLDGVFTAGTDFSTSVSWISENLSLPGIPYKSALNATDKIRMRTCFKENGIPSPEFIEYTSEMDLKESIQNLDFPVVVKPVDSMGARGVKRADSITELKSAVEDSINHSRTGRAIIEEYIDGPEFSLDALVVDGEVEVFGFADRIIKFPPYFVEMGHTIPSNISPEDMESVIDVFSSGVKALGITHGAAKGDMKLGKNGPVIGEIAARLSGGFMSGWTYPYSSGINLIKGGIELALGQPLSVKSSNNSGKYSAERAVISIPGVVKDIIKPEKLGKNIKNMFINVKPGDKVVFPKNNVEKCGNIISVGDTYEKCIKVCDKAVTEVFIRLEENNFYTQEYLFESGSQAFEVDEKLYSELDDSLEIENNTIYIKKIDKILKCRKKDWYNRTVKQVMDEVQKYYNIEFNDNVDCGYDFYKSLVAGSLQGVIYYLDSLEI